MLETFLILAAILLGLVIYLRGITFVIDLASRALGLPKTAVQDEPLSPPVLSAELVQSVRLAWAEGKNPDKIAEEHGTDVSAVKQILNKAA